MPKILRLSLSLFAIIIIYTSIIFGYPYIYAARVSPTHPITYPQPVLIESGLYFGRLRVAVIGDSTAAGQGGTSVEGGFGYQYLATLSSKYQTIEYYNLARGGAKVQDVLNTQIDQLNKLKPDLIMVSIGSNDVTSTISDKDYRNQVSELVSYIQSLPAKVIWLSIPDFITSPILLPPINYILSGRADYFNSIIRSRIESTNFNYINIFDGARNEFQSNPDLNFSKDKYHPSENGYRIWSRLVEQKMHTSLCNAKNL